MIDWTEKPPSRLDGGFSVHPAARGRENDIPLWEQGQNTTKRLTNIDFCI